MENTDSAVAEFDGWLRDLMEGQGSDLHVKVGSPPMIRLPDGLKRMERDPITPVETSAIAESIIPADRKEAFDKNGEVDFAYSLKEVGRFRANVFKQRGSISMVLRRLRFGGPTFEEMGLPDSVRQLADEHRGLILVTGPTGSGKTTTLAAMIGYINETKPVHIVTIEDPIEVLHRDAMASINQREIGNDTQDFHAALRAALRQDPDVILIGEMRDTETVHASHGGRHGDRQPCDRLLPPVPAEAGATGARGDAPRDHLPAARYHGGRGEDTGPRDPREHGPGRRADRRPRADE